MKRYGRSSTLSHLIYVCKFLPLSFNHPQYFKRNTLYTLARKAWNIMENKNQKPLQILELKTNLIKYKHFQVVKNKETEKVENNSQKKQ